MSVKEFNRTLFDLTDDMMAILKASAAIGTAHKVFKNMYMANSQNESSIMVALSIADVLGKAHLCGAVLFWSS